MSGFDCSNKGCRGHTRQVNHSYCRECVKKINPMNQCNKFKKLLKEIGVRYKSNHPMEVIVWPLYFIFDENGKFDKTRIGANLWDGRKAQ